MVDASGLDSGTSRTAMEDHIRLKKATVDVVIHWAAIEHNLAEVLSALLDRKDVALGGVIYFAPSATETRIAIVNAAMRQFWFNRRGEELVMPIWAKIQNKLGKLKRVRNDVVHGIIAGVTMNGKHYARLTPHFGDALRSRRQSMQLPGMGASDVEASIKSMNHYNTVIFELSKILRELRTNPQHGAWLDKLRELALSLQIELPPEVAPTHPSSQE